MRFSGRHAIPEEGAASTPISRGPAVQEAPYPVPVPAPAPGAANPEPETGAPQPRPDDDKGEQRQERVHPSKWNKVKSVSKERFSALAQQVRYVLVSAPGARARRYKDSFVGQCVRVCVRA